MEFSHPLFFIDEQGNKYDNFGCDKTMSCTCPWCSRARQDAKKMRRSPLRIKVK